MVPDLVWMIVKNHNTTKSTSSEISEPHRHDPILGHTQPKFPQKFLKPPLPQTIPFEEISIVWTTVIITTIHLLFEFVRWKSQYLNNFIIPVALNILNSSSFILCFLSWKLDEGLKWKVNISISIPTHLLYLFNFCNFCRKIPLRFIS